MKSETLDIALSDWTESDGVSSPDIEGFKKTQRAFAGFIVDDYLGFIQETG